MTGGGPRQPVSRRPSIRPSSLVSTQLQRLPADFLAHIDGKHHTLLNDLPKQLTPDTLCDLSAIHDDLRFRLSLYREIQSKLPQVRDKLPSADLVSREIQSNSTACLVLLLFLDCACESWKQAYATARAALESPGFDQLGFKAVAAVLSLVQVVAVSLDIPTGLALIEFVCSRPDLPVGTTLPQVRLLLSVLALLDRGQIAEALQKIVASRSNRTSGVTPVVAAAFEYLEAECCRQLGNTKDEITALRRWRDLLVDVGREAASARAATEIEREGALGYAPILQASSKAPNASWMQEALKFTATASDNSKIHWQSQVENAVHVVAQELYELPPPEATAAIREF